MNGVGSLHQRGGGSLGSLQYETKTKLLWALEAPHPAGAAPRFAPWTTP
jgi:hypothetical protein